MKVIKLCQMVFLMFLLEVLTACSSSTTSLKILAAKSLNEDSNGHSLPVIVRVYTLSNDDNFTDATFRELWHDDKSILGSTLIDREEYTMNPNTRMKIAVPSNAQAQYLAVVALFRHPHSSYWRVIRKMPNRFSSTSVELTQSSIKYEK